MQSVMIRCSSRACSCRFCKIANFIHICCCKKNTKKTCFIATKKTFFFANFIHTTPADEGAAREQGSYTPHVAQGTIVVFCSSWKIPRCIHPLFRSIWGVYSPKCVCFVLFSTEGGAKPVFSRAWSRSVLPGFRIGPDFTAGITGLNRDWNFLFFHSGFSLFLRFHTKKIKK